MTKAAALSVDKLCDFVSQIVSKIKCVLLFYLFIFIIHERIFKQLHLREPQFYT